ncbi:MAG: formiminotransferase-cyclodeaminase [Nitriliruptorales bacterium]|nr:formiminotransferase-cyclodeaminase [Nitriliruptorales bacterium]
MADWTLPTFLDDLASSSPAPGGGAVAALQVAFAAGLVGMVGELTIGRRRYLEHEDAMRAARDEARQVRERALALAGEDAEAYAGVSAAFRLPKDTDGQRAERSSVLRAALRHATEVPLETMDAAARTLGVCAEIVDRANRTVVSDLGVAAHSARAGLDSAALNVRVNLGLMGEDPFVTECEDRLRQTLSTAQATAEAVVEAVERSVSDAAA